MISVRGCFDLLVGLLAQVFVNSDLRLYLSQRAEVVIQEQDSGFTNMYYTIYFQYVISFPVRRVIMRNTAKTYRVDARLIASFMAFRPEAGRGYAQPRVCAREPVLGLANAAADPFLKRRKAMTQFEIFAGIGWSTQTHKVAVVDAAGEVLGEREFAQGGEGLAAMVDWILGHSSECKAAAAIERPHGPEADTLLERGVGVFALNSRQLDRFSPAQGFRS